MKKVLLSLIVFALSLSSAFAQEPKVEEIEVLGNKVLAVTEKPDLKIKFGFYKSNNVNAYAQGSSVFFSTQAWKVLSDEKKVAVMAHEVAHIVLGHTENSSNYKETAILLKVLDELTSGLASVAHAVIACNHSRDDEREADEAASLYLDKLGIGPVALAGLFGYLSDQTMSDYEFFLRTHPNTKDRMDKFSERTIAQKRAILSELVSEKPKVSIDTIGKVKFTGKVPDQIQLIETNTEKLDFSTYRIKVIVGEAPKGTANITAVLEVADPFQCRFSQVSTEMTWVKPIDDLSAIQVQADLLVEKMLQTIISFSEEAEYGVLIHMEGKKYLTVWNKPLSPSVNSVFIVDESRQIKAHGRILGGNLEICDEELTSSQTKVGDILINRHLQEVCTKKQSP